MYSRYTTPDSSEQKSSLERGLEAQVTVNRGVYVERKLTLVVKGGVLDKVEDKVTLHGGRWVNRFRF